MGKPADPPDYTGANGATVTFGSCKPRAALPVFANLEDRGTPP